MLVNWCACDKDDLFWGSWCTWLWYVSRELAYNKCASNEYLSYSPNRHRQAHYSSIKVFHFAIERGIYGSVESSSIVYSYTCNTTALTHISTHISPHAWPCPIMNGESHVQARTSILMLSTHVNLCHVFNRIYTFKCKRTSRTHLPHHVKNKSDSLPKANTSSLKFVTF